MNAIIRFSAFLLLFTFSFSCVKQEDDIPVSNYRTVIELSSNNTDIDDVYHYLDGSLTNHLHFTYYDNQMELLYTNDKGLAIKKSLYYLNASGVADSCLDSIFTAGGPESVTHRIFDYDAEGYLLTDHQYVEELNDTAESAHYQIVTEYVVENGNVRDILVNGTNYVSYAYGEIENKFNLSSFLDDHLGKMNKQLASDYYSRVHLTPSTQPESSKFTYSLNSDGWVTESVEITTSSYHVTDGTPSHEKRITRYEYDFH